MRIDQRDQKLTFMLINGIPGLNSESSEDIDPLSSMSLSASFLTFSRWWSTSTKLSPLAPEPFPAVLTETFFDFRYS